ncbi:MAG: T9SS type A sorting domain-containing protein [Bacteroidetes bacterium]|nr:MAG: T9SS type A sorting domain-containing protein [Bacteroidota bacterium]
MKRLLFLFLLSTGTCFSQLNYHVDLSTDSPCGPLSVKEKAEVDDFKVYPNPTRQCFILEHLGQIQRITLLDLTGREIHNEKIQFSKHQICPSSPIPAGTYILCLYTNETRLRHKLRIIP